jgi:hypothetical protein
MALPGVRRTGQDQGALGPVIRRFLGIGPVFGPSDLALSQPASASFIRADLPSVGQSL